mmetsp:Transcript_30307/g.84699  ORF Transcript_30307/g.84699 Transcript_30307/m.84699 type:complete len:226 (+) Transcript_30307:173-850(+)
MWCFHLQRLPRVAPNRLFQGGPRTCALFQSSVVPGFPLFPPDQNDLLHFLLPVGCPGWLWSFHRKIGRADTPLLDGSPFIRCIEPLDWTSQSAWFNVSPTDNLLLPLHLFLFHHRSRLYLFPGLPSAIRHSQRAHVKLIPLLISSRVRLNGCIVLLQQLCHNVFGPRQRLFNELIFEQGGRGGASCGILLKTASHKVVETTRPPLVLLQRWSRLIDNYVHGTQRR